MVLFNVSKKQIWWAYGPQLYDLIASTSVCVLEIFFMAGAILVASAKLSQGRENEKDEVTLSYEMSTPRYSHLLTFNNEFVFDLPMHTDLLMLRGIPDEADHSRTFFTMIFISFSHFAKQIKSSEKNKLLMIILRFALPILIYSESWSEFSSEHRLAMEIIKSIPLQG